MKKEEFVSLVEKKGNFESSKQAEIAIDAVIDSLKEAIANGENVSFSGFGTFKKVDRKGRSGKVPGTDKTYKSEDKKSATFSPSKKYKAQLN